MNENAKPSAVDEAWAAFAADRRVSVEAMDAFVEHRPLIEAAVRAECEKAIDAALHELGVPDENYPAPVANAVDILRAALEQQP